MNPRFRHAETNRFIALLCVILLYLLSFGSDCFCTSNKCRTGFEAFIGGTIGILTGGSAIAWMANPFFLVALILTYRGSKFSIIFSSIALVFCLTFLLFENVIEDEAGHYGQILTLKAGYWLWTSSSLLLVLCNFIFKKPNVVTDDRF